MSEEDKIKFIDDNYFVLIRIFTTGPNIPARFWEREVIHKDEEFDNEIWMKDNKPSENRWINMKEFISLV